MRVGFDGPKSRIFGSENGNEIYVVRATNQCNFTCSCKMYKTYSFCSHTLASAYDNKCLGDFISVALKNPNKLTPPATSGASKHAGKKASVRPRKRKSKDVEDFPTKRKTLGELLQQTEADEEVTNLTCS